MPKLNMAELPFTEPGPDLFENAGIPDGSRYRWDLRYRYLYHEEFQIEPHRDPYRKQTRRRVNHAEEGVVAATREEAIEAFEMRVGRHEPGQLEWITLHRGPKVTPKA